MPVRGKSPDVGVAVSLFCVTMRLFLTVSAVQTGGAVCTT